jgi:flagella basal body P-ring formation protein FlgA
MKYLCSVLIFLLVCVAPVRAAEQQSHARIRAVALAYAQAQTSSLPGKVNIRIRDIDRRTRLPACQPLQAFLPAGATLMGKTSIGVRCDRNPGWTVFVQADVRVVASVLVANRPLAQNTVLRAGDFSVRSGELGQTGILTDPAQAIGKTLRFGIGAGQVLRANMLRTPFVVFQGKTTDVRVRDSGISIQSSGQALNNGASGESVRVRMASGTVISGLAMADGSVEVRP